MPPAPRLYLTALRERSTDSPGSIPGSGSTLTTTPIPCFRPSSGCWATNSSQHQTKSARARYGGAFAPVVELQDGVFPPYLEGLRNRDDIRVIWRELTGLVRSQAIKARLNDLLWCTNRGRDRHRHARSAIEGYLSAATPMARGKPGDEQHLDSVCGLSRALELVRQIKAPELVGRVRDRAVELLVNELQAEDAPSRPGVWMRLLDLLTSLNKDELPAGLGERLVQAHELAVARPDVRLSLFQMEERVARGQRAEIDPHPAGRSRNAHFACPATGERTLKGALAQAGAGDQRGAEGGH